MGSSLGHCWTYCMHNHGLYHEGEWLRDTKFLFSLRVFRDLSVLRVKIKSFY